MEILGAWLGRSQPLRVRQDHPSVKRKCGFPEALESDVSVSGRAVSGAEQGEGGAPCLLGHRRTLQVCICSPLSFPPSQALSSPWALTGHPRVAGRQGVDAGARGGTGGG
jgi:hypothetical protein